jgi:hypothetical protein
MKVDVKDLDMYQDEEFSVMHPHKEKTKKHRIPTEFKRQNNKKLNKPKRFSDKNY